MRRPLQKLQKLVGKRKWLPFLLVVAIWLIGTNDKDWPWSGGSSTHDSPRTSTNRTLWQSGRMVRVEGTVIKLLPTDEQGSRHQRWLMQVPGRQQTLLVAHNIDLAPVVPLKAGDKIEVFGQFEDNAKGGLLHWTHDDPSGRHAEGWVRHKNTLYQ